MRAAQRAVGLLLAQSGSSVLRHDGASSLATAARAFSSAYSGACEVKDISEEWYLRQRKTIPLGNRIPHSSADAWVAPNAVVVGDVDLLDRTSIWYGCVLRGDLNNITVGSVSNIQDRTVIHAARTSPTGLTAATLVGKYVTVEPQCVLRSCRIEDNCIVGAKSVLCEGSMMEPFSVLAPGSVLPPARRVPEGELWAGSPAKFVRKLTKDEMANAMEIADEVQELAWLHLSENLPHGTAWRQVEAWRALKVKQGEVSWVDRRAVRYAHKVEQQQLADAKLTPGQVGK